MTRSTALKLRSGKTLCNTEAHKTIKGRKNKTSKTLSNVKGTLYSIPYTYYALC